ncbi:RNA polymerase sigma factor [Clostridium sp. AF15-17LB]|nr:RNA polymerase sigma factor [Clostridium sp. AF15-17LB]
MEIESIGRVAFDAIYEDNIKIVYKTALRYTGNHHAAEEIAQNVFVKLYTVMEHINLNAVRSWLIVSTRNMSFNFKRDGKREILSDEMYEDWTMESTEDEFEKRLQEKEYREFANHIFEELYNLNERWYEAVTLTYCLEKSQREVAEIMGVSVEVLHSMLYRAKKWIRKNYEDQFELLSKA